MCDRQQGGDRGVGATVKGSEEFLVFCRKNSNRQTGCLAEEPLRHGRRIGSGCGNKLKCRQNT